MATPTPPAFLFAALLLTQATPLLAQGPSYRDFTLVRNRPQHYSSLFQIRAGWRATDPEGENRATGLQDDSTPDGFLYFHTKELTAKQDWALDMYAGQDGYYIGLKDDLSYGKRVQTRLELFGRHKAFYREGYYRSDDFLTRGQYEGSDYTLRLSTGQNVDQGLLLDIGAYYNINSFDRNEQTDLRPDYIIPDDHDNYGGTVTIEQNTLKLDRVLGLPQSGVLATIMAVYEKNGSDRRFGSTAYSTRLPSGFWRGNGRIEFYHPNGRSGVWEILVDGGYADERDRINNYHAERMQGHIYGDGTVGYRMHFGQNFLLKPYAQLQYQKILDEQGITEDDNVWWGGGLDMSLIFGRNMALVLSYSYVNNPSRAPVGLQDDFYGEHQLFVGMDVSFGGGYRR